MADWHVIEHTGRTLVALLELRIAALGIPHVSVGLVTTAAFPALATTSEAFISLLLFQIAGNPELRNRPPTQLPDGTYRRAPLPLELSYLITAWGVRGGADLTSERVATLEEARLLGVVLQAFHDQAEIGRADLLETPTVPVWAPHDGLQLVLENLPLDLHYRIWDAGELGYRLSLAYRVRVAALESDPSPAGPPVTDAVLGLPQ